MTSVIKVDTIQNSTGTDALSIGADGTITSAKTVIATDRPRVYAYNYSGYVSKSLARIDGTTGNGTFVFRFGSTKYNVGSAFTDDATNGSVFTAPVDGTYFISCSIGYKSTVNYMGMLLIVNDEILYEGWSNNDYQGYTQTIALPYYLSSGDTVTFGANSGFTSPQVLAYRNYLSIALLG